VRDKGYGALNWLCNIIDQHIKVSPFWWFMTFWHHSSNSAMTHYDSQQPWGSIPLLIESIHRSSHLPFISYFSMMSHCVSFYYSFSFLIYHLICHVFYDGTSGRFLWLIDEQSLTYSESCLVVQDSPMYIRGSRKTIKFRIYSQLSYFQQVFNLQSWLQHQDLSATLIKVSMTWLHHQSVFILLHQAYFSIGLKG